MKTTTRILQTVAILVAVFAMPHLASAAKVFASMAAAPASTNIVAGVATNVSTTVSVVNGSNGSSVTAGTACAFSVSVSPADPTVTTSLSVTNFNAIKPGAQNTVLTVTTTSLTPSNSYVVTIWANSDPSNSVTITPISTTCTITMASAVFNPQMVWSPAGVDTNWSTAANWSQSIVPGPMHDVFFYNLGATTPAGTIDNVVDANLTVGSLTYGETNNFHTTLIASGKTLTVMGANGLNAGTGTDTGNTATRIDAIEGAGGTLIIGNTTANINVGQADITSPSLASATLDLSGLDNFRATISRMFVGVDSVVKGDNGILNLAKTNVISMTSGSTSPQIDIGDNSQSSGVTGGILNVLLLGQTNALYADSITVGRSRAANSTMFFNSALASPSAYFRGTNGNASRVGTWYVGDGGVGKINGFICNGTNDFSAGTVDALVDKMFVGAGSSATGNGGDVSTSAIGVGTLALSSGIMDVNSLEVGYTVAAVGRGTVNVSGGTLLANTLLELAHGTNALGASSGTLNISGGEVKANAGITSGGGTSAINITGGSLTATNGVITIGTSANPISTFSIANGTLNLAVQNLTPNIAVSSLTAGGTANTINISSVPLLTGFPAQFPLIQYGSASGDLTTFVLGTLPSASPAYGAYISNNVANNSIDIVFTDGPFVPALTWDGTPGGDWDTTTANWKPKSGPDTAYADGNFVTFDDTLAGTSNVNVTTTVSPGTFAVSNSAVNYVFSGSGSISGGATLTKNGNGTLTLAETGGDNFSGGIFQNSGTVILDDANSSIGGNTTVNGGTLQIGNNDTNGALPSGNVTDNGALVFDRANNIIAGNNISGAGTLTQNDTNVLTLSGNSTFAGVATVAQGTLQLGSTNGLGSPTSITVSNAATFDAGGAALFGNGNSGLVVTVSGAGVGGNGAIVNSGASQTKVFHTVTLAGDTTFGGTGDWDIRNSSGNSATADAALNGDYNLTKTGTNTISLRGVTVDTGLENINVQAGNLTFTATATAPQNSLGDSGATATVYTNATLTLDTIGNIPSKNFVLTNGGTLKCSGTNTLNSSLTLAGAANNTISVGSGAQFTITTAIGGSGGFSKNGSSTLFLTANNTYSGGTVVSGGTLALYGGGDGSISSSTNINISSGAVIDVSGRGNGTFTLASGQALNGGVGTNGPGTINGSFIASAGSAVAPGGLGSTNVGTLSIVSNAVLQSATTLKLNTALGVNGWIHAYAITYGGSLVVSNFSGTITNGQTFQLFVATNGIYNAGTFSSVTLPTATGLTWTTNLTVDGTITANVVTGPSPTPTITNIGLLGSNLHLNGTNGANGGTLYVLASTNLALPLTNWTVISTNSFTGSGTFNVTVTNAVNSNAPQSFYIISQPN